MSTQPIVLADTEVLAALQACAALRDARRHLLDACGVICAVEGGLPAVRAHRATEIANSVARAAAWVENLMLLVAGDLDASEVLR